jgi:hypothetical protein
MSWQVVESLSGRLACDEDYRERQQRQQAA